MSLLQKPSGKMRIVMLVDNRVAGDSRVLKTARSAKAAGFDVVVMGLAPSPTDIIIGGVRVLLRPASGFGSEPGSPKGLLANLYLWEAARRVRFTTRIRRVKEGAGKSKRPLSRFLRQIPVYFIIGLNLTLKLFHRLVVRLFRLANRARRLLRRVATGLKRRVRPIGALANRLKPDTLPERMARAWSEELNLLEPDLIHAHDYGTLLAAMAARDYAQRSGRDLRVIYDAHEWVTGYVELGAARHRHAMRIESEQIHEVDSVITVAPPIAEMLQAKYQLEEEPVVVLNAPEFEVDSRLPGPPLRERIRVSPESALLVYAGSVGKGRSLEMCVRGLTLLPDVDLALVVGQPDSNVMIELTKLATELGVRDRLHLTRYVPQEHIVGFLKEATLGLTPMRSDPNTQNSLPTKTREYLMAGIPQVVSDVRTLAAFVREYGVGEVHEADNVEDFARAVRLVLGDVDSYRANISTELQVANSWESQEPALLGAYYRQLGEPKRPDSVSSNEGLPALIDPPATSPILPAVKGNASCRVVIGPINAAGQGWQWARAVERHLDEVSAVSLSIEHKNGFEFPSTVTITDQERTDRGWLRAFEDEIIDSRTHVLLESGNTIAGSSLESIPVAEQVGRFEESGLAVGMILHGSEIRDPTRHAASAEWSTFRDSDTDWIEPIRLRVAKTGPLAEWLGIPTFVATPDLLEFVPWATWLPIAIDPTPFARHASEPLTSPVPVVLHAPSSGRLKGSSLIDPVLEDLDREGLISYRRLDRVPSHHIAAEILAADIVVDQVGLGLYATLAAEAMAAGRVVLGQLGTQIRSHIPIEVPIVEVRGDNLGQVVKEVLENRDRYAAKAATGPGYVERFHDGRASALALATFLGRSAKATGTM